MRYNILLKEKDIQESTFTNKIQKENKNTNIMITVKFNMLTC